MLVVFTDMMRLNCCSDSGVNKLESEPNRYNVSVTDFLFWKELVSISEVGLIFYVPIFFILDILRLSFKFFTAYSTEDYGCEGTIFTFIFSFLTPNKFPDSE